MNSVLKQIKLVALVGGALIFVLAGCNLDKYENDPLPPAAYVSIYNASPNSPGLSIIVDQKTINNNTFDYAEHTGYLRFYTGARNIGFGPYGASSVDADTTVTFESDKAYSVFVVNTYQDADVLVLSDDTAEPAAGKAKIRFLNLSPDAPEVNLYAEGNETALFSGQSFKEASDFIEVDAKELDFQVKLASGGDAILNVPNARLQDGWIYTILVRGYRTPPGGSTAVLSADIISD
jgi:hypothetical protein